MVIFGQYQGYRLFGQKCLIFITFQSAIKINQFQFLVIFGQNTKAIALLFGQTFNAVKINHCGHFWPKEAKMPHFHHFSKSKSINFNCGHFWKNTTAIALPFGQKCLIFITFQSAIKIQFQFWSFLAKIPSYSLTFWPKVPHFHHFFAIKINQFQFWSFLEYQGYLTFSNIPHFNHFSICNQNQSISIVVIFGQNTKAIALFWPNMPHFHHFSICNQNQSIAIWSFLAKIPRL